MKNLMTRKLLFGMLMTLVLAFSVQGIANALTFGTTRTGDLQTVIVNNEVTISFSVSLGSNTTRIIGPNGNLIKDSTNVGGAENARIDSSGYLVAEINGREYRTIETNPTGDLVVEPRPTYSDETPSTAGSPTTPYYVDSSGNVVDANGNAVYVQTGAGTRADPGNNVAANPWRYTRARANPSDKVPDANRYHFNQEAISILAPADVNLIRVGSYPVNVDGDTPHLMNEAPNSVNEDKLTSTSIRLTYRVTQPGDYTITITDTTPDADRPNTTPPLSFTIFGVPSYDGTTALALTGAGADGFETRNDNADPQVNTLFTSGTNVPLIYSVEGSGRLYIMETYTNGSPTSQSRPTNNLSTSSAATVHLDMNGSTNKVTAYVRDQNAAETSKTIIFIFNYATIEIISGNNQTGVPNSRLIDPLGVRVKDAKGRTISGLPVTFTPATGQGSTLQPVIGTEVYLTDPPEDNSWASTFAATVQTFQATATVPAPIDANTAALVPTDRSGEAKVYLELGEAGNKTVAVGAGGKTATFYVTSSVSTDIPSLEISSGNNQRAASNGKVAAPLVVRVLASDNQPLPQRTVTFTTTKGYLTTPSTYQATTPTTTINGPATQVTAVTDVNGKAAVTYDLVEHSGAADVIAEISSNAIPVYQRRVTFTINGTGSTGGTNQPTTIDPYLSISVSPTSAAAGASGRVTVNAFNSNRASVPNVPVTLRATGITFSPNPVSSGSSATFTFPSSGTRTITATATNYTTDTATITVTQPRQTTPTLSLSSSTISGAAGSTQSITATVLQSNGSPAPGIAVTLRLGNLSPVILSTNTSGQVSHTFILPSTATTLSVSANVLGTSLSESVSISITGTTPTPPTTGTGTPPTTEEPVSLPSQLSIPGSSSLDGEINRRLSNPLRVRVLDDNNAGVSAETVFFSIAEGSGRLSPARTRTDADGYAEVGFTPQSSGTIEIEVTSGTLDPVTFTITTGEPPSAITKFSGDNQSGRPGAALANPFVVEVIDENDDPVSGVTVTFAVTAGGGTLSATSVNTNASGRTQTTLTLGSEPGDNTVAARVTGITPVNFKATSGAEVLVRSALRPPMYWVGKADGTLHRLVDAEIENLAPNVQGVTSIAVDSANALLYFAVQTGANKGTIRRAGLNGAGAQTLKKLTAAPMGIAVDSAGGTVYWTNSRGRIQSIATEGSAKITNVVQNLSSPGAIALSNGYLYWGESLGRVRRMSLSADDQAPENIATGLGEPLSIAIAKGKVYWVERSAGGSGSLQRANLNGSNIEELKTFASGIPTSLAVDSSENRIYWTKGTGKIQRSNLMGRFVKDIATGLMNPGSIALGTAQEEEDDEPADNPGMQQRQTPPPTTYSKYDINRDGAINNTDTRLVAGAVGQSGDAITNPRTDVDGSGTVDVTDLILVLGSLDDDAAAPVIDIDVKALDVDFDRVQEQVEMLLASGDRSIAAQRALRYLQHLLASARPHETVLLANYPNPFNPETWIPYHLADSTDVKVNIYNAQGILVRALTLGHQTAGYYTSRSRAAYWDGRNALGERVASGIYFYQLQTDEVSPMRKMVILK